MQKIPMSVAKSLDERFMEVVKDNPKFDTADLQSFSYLTEEDMQGLFDLSTPAGKFFKGKVMALRDTYLKSLSRGEPDMPETDTIISQAGKSSASDFAAAVGKPFFGFGFMNHVPFYDPTDVSESGQDQRLYLHFAYSIPELNDRLRGSRVESICANLSKTIVTYNDLSNVSETKPTFGPFGKDLTVQSAHLDALRDSIFRYALHTSTGKSEPTLQSLNCDVGIASPRSIPDGVFADRDEHARGVFEVNHNINTPAECIRQGATEASNIAIAQLNLGVDRRDIIVPVVGSNGYLIQFGAVIVLEPSFPVFVMLSHVLDMTSDVALMEAARFLGCIKLILMQPLNVPARSPNVVTAMALSKQAYHVKPLQDFFSSTGNLQTGLFHYFKVMSRLHSCLDCRNYVVFPICVREYNDSMSESMLVYPKLNSSFRIGLPTVYSLRMSFMEQLVAAVAAFHNAGVVHLDLYLSNIMWRRVGGTNEVELKVVDWDAAHFLTEDLMPAARVRLADRRAAVMKIAAQMDGQQETLKYYDLSLLRVLQRFIDEPALRVREKKELDEACCQFQLRFIADMS